MSKAEVTGTISAPLERVWAVVGSFTGLMDASGTPYTTEGEGIGMTRTLDVMGSTITERFEELDEANHLTSYSIVESPLPVANYRAWIELTAAGDDETGIRWWSQFEPVGTDETQIVALIEGIYQGGIKSIQKAVAS